jgi:hypothetical protein
MASAVDICNLALGHLGDSATVASIDPPEGSAQAEHCARFYPIARDTLLEMHNWNFIMRRASLALLVNDITQWKYKYALPADFLSPVSVLPPESIDDYSVRYMNLDGTSWAHNYSPAIAAGQYVPQPFSVETQSDGTQVLYTNVENAVLRYTAKVTDTSVFSSLFVMALSWHLASMLAGPVIKGDQGSAEAKRCAQMMASFLAQAQNADSNERSVKPEHIVGWMAGR